MRQNRREVSFEEGQNFAWKHKLLFFETSAKTALNVESAFLSTASEILNNIAQNEYDLTNEVTNKHLDLILDTCKLQSIGIKPGNALPNFAGSAAADKKKRAPSGQQL